MLSIELQKVNFSYRSVAKGKVHILSVLKNADMAVARGDIVAICGRSGQGKSTILRMIAGLEDPRSGHILYNSLELGDRNPLRIANQKVSFVFQNSALISNMDVYDNVALPLRYHRKHNEAEIEERVFDVLDKMLVDRTIIHNFPHALSAGLQKRVAVARALVTDPEILLLDEPTAGLDNVNKRSLSALIYNLHELHRTTILMVTHDLHLARNLDAKICFLHDGQISSYYKFHELRYAKDEHIQDMISELMAEKQVEVQDATDW